MWLLKRPKKRLLEAILIFGHDLRPVSLEPNPKRTMPRVVENGQ